MEDVCHVAFKRNAFLSSHPREALHEQHDDKFHPDAFHYYHRVKTIDINWKLSSSLGCSCADLVAASSKVATVIFNRSHRL